MPPMPCRPTMRPRRAGRPGVLLSYRSTRCLIGTKTGPVCARGPDGGSDAGCSRHTGDRGVHAGIVCRRLASDRTRRPQSNLRTRPLYRVSAASPKKSIGLCCMRPSRTGLRNTRPRVAPARPTDADRAGNQAATDCAGQPLMRCEAELRLPGAHKARAWAVPTRRSRYGLGSANQGRIETSGSRARRVAMSAARSPLRTPLSPERAAQPPAPAPRRRRPARRRA